MRLLSIALILTAATFAAASTGCLRAQSESPSSHALVQAPSASELQPQATQLQNPAPQAPPPVQIQTPSAAASSDDQKSKSDQLLTLPARSNWDPTSVHLKCGVTEGCPRAIGVILFVRATDLVRCTGFLMASDEVMTSGHCDFSSVARGFFIARSDLGGPAEIRALGPALFKTFTPSAEAKNPELASGRPDAVVFRLSKPIAKDKIEPLTLAFGAPSPYVQLNGYVVDATPNGDLELEIHKIECGIHRDESKFPYDLTEAPDVIRAFACQGRRGESGSPLFAPNGTQVEALFNGFDNSQFIEVTNARCLDYLHEPAQKCVSPSNDDIQERFKNAQTAMYNSLAQRALPKTWSTSAASAGPSESRFQLRFQNFLFQLKSANPLATNFDVVHFPVCRLPGWDLKTVGIPVESVQMELDGGGALQLTTTDVKESTGHVTRQTDDVFEVQIIWQPADAPYLHPEEEFSRKYGNTFSIALPPCPR